MKSFYLLLFILVISGCSHSSDTKKKQPVADSNLYYPYVPVYSNKFVKGKDLYGRMVLDEWKEYESGDIRKKEKDFADSLTLVFPDVILKGKKQNVLSLWKKRRDAYAEVQTYVDSWMPVSITDKGEEQVFIWGRQDCTTPNGKRDYFIIHQVWKFTGSGKISRIDEYRTHPY